MALWAPAASALAISPENRIPPSAIKVAPLPFNAPATLATAVICGMPTPLTMRVVQIEPGPMPTLTASAPLSTSASAASAVATLPPITWVSLNSALICWTISSTPLECPCAVSTTSTSTLASTSRSTRSMAASPTPTAAPTRSRSDESRQASGYSDAFCISLTVTRPAS